MWEDEDNERISRVDIFVNGRPYKTLNARNGVVAPTKVSLATVKGNPDWLVQAFDHNNNLIAVSRRK